jgi:RNase adaptor protein for sRNA GlmZ degradation
VNDDIWLYLKNKFNVKTDRKLHIITCGTQFILDVPKQCQKVFNSAILRNDNTDRKSPSFKALLKLRGTSSKIQQEVRDGKLFKNFMENVVQEIEDNNLATIGIICRAGHHRSVACAEMC